MKNRINLLFPIFLIILIVFSCKKDKQLSVQYYGEPILESKEHFPYQELFSNKSYPSISSDGNYLAYFVDASVDSNTSGLWMINLNSSEKYLIKGSANSPNWAKDSKKLCYSLNGDIYIDNIKGDSSIRLTYDGGCYEPQWHPKNDTIS